MQLASISSPTAIWYEGEMRNWLSKQFELDEWRRRMVFWGGAIATGAAAVLFAKGSDFAMALFSRGRAWASWWPYCSAPIGLAVCAALTNSLFKGAEGSGIPQTIAALAMPTEVARDQVLSLRIAVGKAFLTLVGLASGGSVGREGPTVQVGASIMHSLRRFARFSAVDLDRGLILAGGAAGVAAAFNTPLAGIVFAIEELSRSFEERTSGTILTAVILAGVCSLAMLGNYTYFGSTSAIMSEPRMWLAVPVCGVVGGALGGAFALAMVRMGTALPAGIQQLRREHPVAFAAGCGVLLAVIGWLSSGTTFGTGYAEAKRLLQNDAAPTTGFALWKAFATLISYLSGIPCGVFAPSLAVGAGLGAHLFGWWPIAPAGAMVILSMAAYFAGVVQAPLTALVIVTEMTGNRSLTLPLMGVVLIGRGASALVCRRALYRTLADRYMPEKAAAVSEL
jgi:H+/Cl- antiporter ClcA